MSAPGDAPSFLVQRIWDARTAFYVWAFPKEVAENLDGLIEAGSVPGLMTLVSALKVAIGLTLIRSVLERILFEPAAYHFMALRRQKRAPFISALAIRELEGKLPSKEAVQRGAQQTGRSVEFIKDYLSQQRRCFLVAKRVQKFTEACWRFLLYSLALGFGLWATVNQPWFRDPYVSCWVGWPQQHVPQETVWYYSLELGLYLHLAARMLVEVKRRDFWEMVIHHASTIFLILFSWLVSFMRVGSLVMLVHDCSDVPLELAKLFNYTKSNPRYPHARHAADAVFFVFASTFFYSRLYLFPKYILYNTMVSLYEVLPGCPSVPFFNALLSTLQALHIFWACLIVKMIYLFLVKGIEKDVRSDTEDEAEDEGGISDSEAEYADAKLTGSRGDGGQNAAHVNGKRNGKAINPNGKEAAGAVQKRR